MWWLAISLIKGLVYSRGVLAGLLMMAVWIIIAIIRIIAIIAIIIIRIIRITIIRMSILTITITITITS